VLPNLIFSLPAGVIADRKSNKKLILVGYAGRGLVVLTLSLLLRTLYKKLKQNVGRRAIKRMYGGNPCILFLSAQIQPVSIIRQLPRAAGLSV